MIRLCRCRCRCFWRSSSLSSTRCPFCRLGSLVFRYCIYVQVNKSYKWRLAIDIASCSIDYTCYRFGIQSRLARHRNRSRSCKSDRTRNYRWNISQLWCSKHHLRSFCKFSAELSPGVNNNLKCIDYYLSMRCQFVQHSKCLRRH